MSRWGLRKPYAQISVRAPGVATNGLSFGTRYRPFSLTTLDDSCGLEIRDDAVDLPDHRIETLRVGPDGLPRFARAAVTAADVEHAPVRVAGPRRRVEDEIAQRMDARVELDAHQLAGGSLERRVADVGIGPFDQHAVAQDLAGRGDGLRRLVAAHVETGRARRVWRRRRVDRRVFDVHGVEAAVPPVVRVELDADETVGVAGFVREAVEESGVTLDKATKKFTAYLDFNGREGHTGLFHRFAYETGYANGLVSLQFDPDYRRNGRFYTIHIEDPAVEAPASPTTRTARPQRPRLHDRRPPSRRPATSSAKAC